MTTPISIIIPNAAPKSEQSPSMHTLGTQYGTDKITHHAYDRYYPREIDFLKTIDGAGMIEIGIHTGSSLNMWMDYFPKAHIYGLDIGGSYHSDRATVLQADQSNERDLNAFRAAIKHPIHFILDDGSHVPEHVLLTFNTLWKPLQRGGVYVIEDIETGFWTHGDIYGYPTEYGYQHRMNLVTIFKLVADYVNREFLTAPQLQDLRHRLACYDLIPEVLDKIASVCFAHNCIFIRKVLTDIDVRTMARAYRGQQYLQN